MKPVECNGTEDLRLNLLTQEIKFAKMLAGNTFDGALKEKHIDKLGSWLKNRAACTEGMDIFLVFFNFRLFLDQNLNIIYPNLF